MSNGTITAATAAARRELRKSLRLTNAAPLNNGASVSNTKLPRTNPAMKRFTHIIPSQIESSAIFVLFKSDFKTYRCDP
jgi:hypothetical protein